MRRRVTGDLAYQPCHRGRETHAGTRRRAFLWESVLKEHAKGFASKPVSAAVLDAIFGAGNWSRVPCSVHHQPNAKRTRIDDFKRGGQNLSTAYSEKFKMTNAFMPGVKARLMRQIATRMTMAAY